jgi:hypothetical protein
MSLYTNSAIDAGRPITLTTLLSENQRYAIRFQSACRTTFEEPNRSDVSSAEPKTLNKSPSARRINDVQLCNVPTVL